jgi:hypothetical protein
MRRTALLVALAAGFASWFAPAATAASPFARHAVPGVGVSLSVPRSWIAVDHREVLTQDLIERLSRDNPNLTFLFTALKRGGVKFVAADPDVRGGFATNVNVVVSTTPSGMSHEVYQRALVAQLQALSSVKGRVASATVTLPAGRVVRLRYNLQLVVQGRSLTTETLQYAFLRSGRSIVVTYTTTPANAAGYSRTFAASARSIRVAGR